MPAPIVPALRKRATVAAVLGDGRTVSRHVTAAEVPALPEAIAGYQRVRELTEQYLDRFVAETLPLSPSGGGWEISVPHPLPKPVPTSLFARRSDRARFAIFAGSGASLSILRRGLRRRCRGRRRELWAVELDQDGCLGGRSAHC